MSHLVPEQRMDKNGVLTTKHVRTTPRARNAASRVPAPSLGNTPSPKTGKAAEKAYKPTARQLEQKERVFNSEFASYSVELKEPQESPDKWGRSTTFTFNASDAEFYDLLGVASPGDAVRLLNRGIRTSEEAVEYMRGIGADGAIRDRKGLFQSALEHGIPVANIIGILHTIDHDSPYAVDAMEMATMSSLKQQFSSVRKDVLNGELLLSDVKYLGATKLKSYGRLVGTVSSLKKVREPNAPFTMEDIKYLVDRAASEGTDADSYARVMDYFMDRGTGVLKEVRSFEDFYWVAINNVTSEDKWDRTEYEVLFRNQYDPESSSRQTTNFIMQFRDAGVDPKEAGRMTNEGMTPSAVIGVLKEGVEKPLSEGWL